MPDPSKPWKRKAWGNVMKANFLMESLQKLGPAGDEDEEIKELLVAALDRALFLKPVGGTTNHIEVKQRKLVVLKGGKA
jgi:hypothetical protein